MSAHNYQDVYDDLGIDLKTLGCVMLGTETPDTSFIDDKDLYYANDPKLFWIDGRAGSNSHITLKYGLLNSVKRKHVERVIEGLAIPDRLYGNGITKFESPYPDEPYECIVLEISTDRSLDSGYKLMELHNHLNYLPHINTFPDFKAHVTLAYVHKGWYDENYDNIWDYSHDPDNSPVTTSLDFGKMA